MIQLSRHPALSSGLQALDGCSCNRARNNPLSGSITDLLAEQGILCLPGSVAEIPGHFRISLTANEDMIARSLPGFARAIAKAEKMAQGRV